MTDVVHVLLNDGYSPISMKCGAIFGQWVAEYQLDRGTDFIDRVTCEDCKEQWALKFLGDMP